MPKSSNILQILILTYCVFLNVNQVYAQATPRRCETADGKIGNCIPITTCTSLYQLLTKSGLTDDDVAFLRRSQCDYQHGTPYVCCNVPRPSPTIVRNGNLPVPPDCGLQMDNRIYGGKRTKIDAYPWMALLEYSKGTDKTNGFHCGGTLINERYVITAAHCVSEQIIPETWSLISVRLGEWDLTTNKDCSRDLYGGEDCADPHKDVAVIEQIIHPDYNVRTHRNDIALLRLGEVIAFTDFIKPICLPLAEPLRSDGFEGVAMDIAGWGYTEEGHSSAVKLSATVLGRNFTECKKKYRYAARVELWDKQLCAGSNVGADSCKGDSGGPLMTLETIATSAHYFLAGITSFGSTPCGLENFPGVYTRVGSYIDWIKANVKP